MKVGEQINLAENIEERELTIFVDGMNRERDEKIVGGVLKNE